MESTKLKLLFLERVLTDTVKNKDHVTNFFQNKIYPDDQTIQSICNEPIDELRLYGRDWPQHAHTMIGMKRLHSLHETLDYVRENNIGGDFIETGVWKGGACIFAKMYFDLYSMDKKVFVADSFAGLPKPQWPEDNGDTHYTVDVLRVSMEDVQNNFSLYGCLDDKVVFLKGWFEDTLPNNPMIDKLSVLRMDGDMYKSTMDVFSSCYHKVTKGGRVIIDDYCLPNCKKAVDKFRLDNNYTEEVHVIDQCGIMWSKK